MCFKIFTERFAGDEENDGPTVMQARISSPSSSAESSTSSEDGVLINAEVIFHIFLVHDVVM